MIENVIRTANVFIFVSFFCFYIFAKALNIYIEKKKIALIFLLSAIFCAGYVMMKLYIPSFSVLIYVIALIIANRMIFKTPIVTTAVTSSIAFGISYCFSTVSAFLTIPYWFITYGKIKGTILDIRIDFLVADFVSGLIHVILCLLLFKIKKFKYGFTFLKKEIPSIFGIIVSVFVPIVVSLSNIVTDKSNINYLIPLIYLCFSGFVIVFWALFCIKREYIGNIRIRDTEILHRTVVDLQNEVNDYKENNEKLAKIIHRDNKEIPALELLVEKAIMNVKTADANITELEEIENNLKKLAKERKNIVLESEKHKDTFQKTNSILLNSTLSFMHNRAVAQNTKFEVSICDFSLSNETEYHINTILADLLENAIFATETVEKKMIKVKFSYENEIFKIFVFDSGKNFNIDFFKYFGMFKYTSRKKKGGSGIGTMSTIELCKKHNASYTINENVDSDFTKYVSIEFDGKSEIRILTSRQIVIEICKSRGDIICFNDKVQVLE